MKHLQYILLAINFGLNCSAQNFQLKIIGSSLSENKTIDSLYYNSNHKNIKSLNEEIILMSEKLNKLGFIENKILQIQKIIDSSYIAKFNLGKKIKSIHIYIGRNPETNEIISLKSKNDTIILPYRETEIFLNQTLQKLEQNGFALTKLKLTNLHDNKQILYADLQIESNQKRNLNSIIVKLTDENKKNIFPEGYLTQINRKYKKQIFNKEVVSKIHHDFEKFRFVNQIKYPEILFTKDSTKVYLYLEKRKSNTFDGFIGFSNNENNKIILNGYLDLSLENTLRVGEQFSLNWKSDGKNQKTFKADIDLPYLFKSPFGLKSQIYIYKQDSIFQNTKTAIDLGYIIDYNTRIYLGYQSTESNDIQNTNNNTLSDYNNSFINLNLEHTKLDYVNLAFSIKSKLSITLGSGKRTTNGLVETLGTSKQTYININTMNNFYLNKKNCININYHNYFLKSDTYIINEQYRFGGINSIRGFAENSLQANLMTAIISEYRYIFSQDLYINTIMDYCYYEDKSTNNKENLFGLGLGIGLRTKNGLLKLNFANGFTDSNEIKFYNTITTICYNIKF